MISLKTTKCINFETEKCIKPNYFSNTSSIRDIKVGGEWKYKFTPQVSLSDQTLIKNRDSGLEEALEFVTRHDVVDMNSFKEVDGGMTIEFIYRKSK